MQFTVVNGAVPCVYIHMSPIVSTNNFVDIGYVSPGYTGEYLHRSGRWYFMVYLRMSR